MTYPVSPTTHAPVTDGVTFLTEAIYNPLLLDVNALQKGGLADFNRVVVVGANTNYPTIASGITAAIALTPAFDSQVVILIMSGTYNEGGLVLPSFVSLVGISRDSVNIMNDIGQPFALTLEGRHTISDLRFSRDGATSVGTVNTSVPGAKKTISIRNVRINGGGDGNEANGEINFTGFTLATSLVRIENVEIVSPANVESLVGTGHGAIVIFSCAGSFIMDSVRVRTGDPTDLSPLETMHGVDVIGGGAYFAVRYSTILCGNGSTHYPVAQSLSIPPKPIGFITFNSFRYLPQIDGLWHEDLNSINTSFAI